MCSALHACSWLLCLCGLRGATTRFVHAHGRLAPTDIRSDELSAQMHVAWHCASPCCARLLHASTSSSAGLPHALAVNCAARWFSVYLACSSLCSFASTAKGLAFQLFCYHGCHGFFIHSRSPCPAGIQARCFLELLLQPTLLSHDCKTVAQADPLHSTALAVPLWAQR